MAGSSWPKDMKDQLAVLPPDIRELVESMPEAKAREVLAQLLVASELDYRPLTAKDIETIKARTAESSQFGFLSVDVDITWEEVSRENYIALGAFDAARDVPVAFIVAEVSRLEDTREFLEQEQGAPDTSAAAQPASTEAASASPAGTGGQEDADNGAASSSTSSSSTAPQPASIRKLLRAGGWSPKDVIVGVYYIGVDFEYRRQGIGQQLLNYVRDIAVAARARVMWLNVAEYNANALAFYQAYGFQQTDTFKKGARGNHYLCVYPIKASKKKGLRGRSATGKGFGAMACATLPASSQPRAAPAAAARAASQLPFHVSADAMGMMRGARAGGAGCCRFMQLAPGRSSWAPRALGARLGML